jgi:hypothetical protein
LLSVPQPSLRNRTARLKANSASGAVKLENRLSRGIFIGNLPRLNVQSAARSRIVLVTERECAGDY